MSDATLTLLVLAVMMVGFFTQAVPLYITALSGAIVLGLLGVIPIGEVYAGLANPILVLFAGMFVIGASLFHTGLAQQLGEWVVRACGRSENRLMWGVMIVASVLSTFASNTGTAAALIPTILSLCHTAGIPAARQLMPMAFTTGFGGFSTLVGTPPNIIVTESLQQAGHRPFGFFEFAWLGIPLAVAGMAYLAFIGKRFLPEAPCEAEEVHEHLQGHAVPADRTRMWISGLILLGVIVAMAVNSDRLPLETVAVIGALLCVLTGCVKHRQAIESIEWETILLFGAMFAVARAIEDSGAGAWLAGGILFVLGQHPPGWLVLTALFVVSTLLTTFLSNTATAALLAPIGLSLAQEIGANPEALLMMIAAAGSCSFLTPLGTPPNALVLKPGNYNFTDYLKVGSGLTLVCLLVALAVIPLRWPVYD